MKIPTKELIQELSSICVEPCVSIYIPTHSVHPDNLQDPIRYQNLLNQLESSLLKKYPASEVKRYLQPLENIREDQHIWNHNLDGLAIFSSGEIFELISLTIPVAELIVVAESFHTKPLRQYLQTADRFQILALSLHETRLLEGNKHSVCELDLGKNIPMTVGGTFRDQVTEKNTMVALYGGVEGQSGNMHHGHGFKKNETGIDAARFFRVLAETVDENFSKPSGLPLILAALPEHRNLFKKVNKNPFLLREGIELDPDTLTADKLGTMAWEVMEPEYEKSLKNWSSKIRQAIKDQKGSDLIADIVSAATSGRVETLLLEADRMISGKIVYAKNERIETDDLSNTDTDDLLDNLGELVEKFGGNVLIVPADKIKLESGAAAMFRY